MKYGIILNLKSQNIGDDIQTYAQERLFPQTDYIIDRENLDSFESKNNEKVAVILNGWFLWNKWNWPPADCLIPKIISFHYQNRTLGVKGGKEEYFFLKKPGGEYLKKYGPVGARDTNTAENLSKIGIETYFSGCLTLTLPRQKLADDAGEYIVIADIENRAVKEKIKTLAKANSLKTIETTHAKPNEKNVSWEIRRKNVENLLTIYQNAKCVITKRLHCALPCHAMETPVLVIGKKNVHRFKPYYDFLHVNSEEEFLANKGNYNIINPPKNDDLYLKYRNKLKGDIADFIGEIKKKNSEKFLYKEKTYSKKVFLKWKNRNLKKTAKVWGVKVKKPASLLRKLKNVIKFFIADSSFLEKENKKLIIEISKFSQKKRKENKKKRI